MNQRLQHQIACGVPPLFPEGIVADRYRIVATIGVGGSATVFEAEDLESGEMVALKAIPADDRLRRRAKREIRAASALDHGAIVRLLDSREDDHYIFVAFELVRGSDLAGVLREGRLEESEVMRAVAAVCDALEHAHERGVIHRDVKPGNILLREDGILKLTDFGIAQVDHPDATIDENLLGTLSYMAPEQVRGELLTGAVDVWASALVAYEALTRKNPYRSKNPVELVERHRKLRLSLREERPDLPLVATKMIDRALDLDYQRRPLPGQLRDALLRGAVALERDDSGAEPSLELPLDLPLEPRVRLRKRWLRVVPDLRDDNDERESPSLNEQSTSRVDRLAARLLPHWPVALTGVAGVAMLGALPFYPTGWPIALGLLAALLALRLPFVAGGLLLVTALPLLGNLAFGLVPLAAVTAVAWLMVMARDGRRVLLPALAPLLTLCFAWALYPLLAGSAKRASSRVALGAAGALVMTLLLGLAGIGSPLTDTTALNTIGSRIAGSDGIFATASVVGAAIGFAPLLLSAVWGLLALTAPAVLNASGRPLLIASSLWVGLGTLGTLAAPLLVSGALIAPVPVAAGAGATSIIILIRSRMPEAASATPVEAAT